MKKFIAGSVGVLTFSALSMINPANAAELLDVKPVGSGSGLAVEVMADIPMTYTYYKVPGQARAVIDIADADPEKVEPLIVVNKGAVASISVDKAMISDMTVSRLVFNLVSESDINVSASPDRKKLTVTFGGGKASAAAAPVVSAPPPVEPPAVIPEPVKKSEPVVAPVTTSAKQEEDPLGLDEPQSAPASVAAIPAKVEKKAEVAAVAPAAVAYQAVKEEEDPLGLNDSKGAAAPVASPAKLKPVVPAETQSTATAGALVKGIVVGATYIDIQTNGNVDKIKHMKLIKPDRLAVDIPGDSSVSVKSITVNKFGISKLRVGKTPGVVRVVLDAVKTPFPAYSVTTTDTGVRISFK